MIPRVLSNHVHAIIACFLPYTHALHALSRKRSPMPSKWEDYSRFGLSVASTAASVGFSAAKYGTSIGVRVDINIIRGVVRVAYCTQ